MRIMICGSIGYSDCGGIGEIKRFYSLLRRKGFEIVDDLKSKGTDYSDVKDFRDKKELCSRIVEHDLEYIKKTEH